ncbi:MAG: LysM peptidoglycan-binding domain-containing protein, partial [Phycisphaerales bacterium]|nr:LysM peptidoglycan-binding domain-containing protein [Hyphomonadaceae bacterium]
MTTHIRSLAFAGLVAASGCASLPQMPDISMPRMSSIGAAAPDRGSAREHVRAAVDYLGDGQEAHARAELSAALELSPNSSSARRLMQQIDSDPRELLGQRARSYTVQPGETMSQLAERFLGDSLMFYALARYNGLDAPNQLSAGQSLSIPRRATVTATSSTPSLALPPQSSAGAPSPTP